VGGLALVRGIGFSAKGGSAYGMTICHVITLPNGVRPTWGIFFSDL